MRAPVEQKTETRTTVAAGASREGSPAAPRSGPAAAVVLAAGIACFVLGLLSVLVAASDSIADALTLSNRVGEVSGISTMTSATFFVTWGALAVVWRRVDPSLARVAAMSAVLAGLGLLGTFPPVFNAFGG
jgi:hypothetical protein